MVLAVGHEFGFNTDLAPPLPYWLAEIAFRLAGGHLIGVYVLSAFSLASSALSRTLLPSSWQ